MISWATRKQPSVALSTYEAKYVPLAAAIQEGKLLIQLLNTVTNSDADEHATIYYDTPKCIALAKNTIRRQRSNLVAISYHFIRTEVQNSTINLD